MATVQHVLPRIKVALLKGDRLSHMDALKRFGTFRLSEYIRRLRVRNRMDIITEMVTKNGKSYGVYYLNKKK